MDLRADPSGPATIDTPLGGGVRFDSMGGIEGLSRPFVYEVDIISDRSDIKPSELLGKSVTVHLSTGDDGDDVRHWNGLVTGVVYIDTRDDGDSRYRLTVRPWLWQLSLCADCRVFQQKTIPEIVTQVFQDRGFAAFESSLFDEYERQEYVVQYRETDLAFVTRLLEREGIYYFFKHEDGKHTLVLADSPLAHTDCGQIGYAPDDEHRDATMQYVRRWRAEASLGSGVSALADYDFTKPQVTLYTQATAQGDDSAASAKLQVYDFPGGFDNFADADDYARLRLAQARRDVQGWVGETNVRRLAVGLTFDLTDHPRDDQNENYLVTSLRVRLKGHDTQSTTDEEDPFDATFGATLADQTYRPPLATRKPVVRGPQTAVVVGPAGQEIWTDQYGRVRVQFPWDRVGQRDENSSCWVRVSQAWAGSGFGAQFIPRIGQEVIVAFLEGDPDRPIITGCVYNGSNEPPFPLPNNQTQSGWRSRSTPGGSIEGGNEIRFEDAIGFEDLYVQAERTQTTLVKADQTERIVGNRTTSVGFNDDLTVTGNRTQNVSVAETVTIGAAHTMAVGAAQILTVGATQDVSVGAKQSVKVLGDRELEVSGDERVRVDGVSKVHVGGDVQESVDGNREAEVGGKTDQTFDGDYTERHHGHRAIIVGSGDTARSAVVHVEGRARAYASKTLEVEAIDGFTLICGKSQIAVTPEGITLISPTITLSGKEVDVIASTMKATVSDALTLGASTVTLETSGAKVALDSSSASVTGSKVKLGSGSGDSSQVQDQPVKITRVQMKDAQGKPRANARVLLTKGDEQRMTVLDADGVLELVGDASYSVSFPDDPAAKG